MKLVTSIRRYLVGKFRSFHNSDNSFVVMVACDRAIGVFTSDSGDPLRPLKYLLITYTVLYEMMEFISFFFLRSINLEQHFITVFLMVSRVLCIINWFSLALFRSDLRQVWTRLRDLQRYSPDPRRVKYIRSINWFAFGYLVENMGPFFMWVVTGQVGSPLKIFQNDILHQVNNFVYPLAVMLVSLMFCYSIIVGCSIITALTLEFMLLGTDIKQIFLGAGSLEQTIRKAPQHWDNLESTFKSCVQRHQNLLNLAFSFREHVKLYFLSYLGTAFVFITFSCFHYALTYQNENPKFTFTAAAATTTTINLILFGYLSDQLEGQATLVRDQLYCSDWTDRLFYSRQFSKQYKATRQLMMIVMQSTQKKIGLTCGNYAAMSLVTCRKLLQFAYSALTVLLTFLD